MHGSCHKMTFHSDHSCQSPNVPKKLFHKGSGFRNVKPLCGAVTLCPFVELVSPWSLWILKTFLPGVFSMEILTAYDCEMTWGQVNNTVLISGWTILLTIVWILILYYTCYAYKRTSPNIMPENFQIYRCAMILAANLLSVKASISLSPAVVLVEQAASVCAQTHPRGRGEISSLCSAMISANSHVAAHKASICSLQRHSIQLQLDSLKRVFFIIYSGPRIKSFFGNPNRLWLY